MIFLWVCVCNKCSYKVLWMRVILVIFWKEVCRSSNLKKLKAVVMISQGKNGQKKRREFMFTSSTWIHSCGKYLNCINRFGYVSSKWVHSWILDYSFLFMEVLNLQTVQLGYPPLKSNWKRRNNVGFNTIRCGIAEPSGKPAPMGEKSKYKDGIFEKVFMGLFARKMEKFAPSKGREAKKKLGLFEYDYESFVDVSRSVMQGRSRIQQQEVVREVLMSMLPPGAPEQFRKLFPPTKWAAEFNAALTVPFFHWLVGPAEVVEVEINGEKQRSGVLIKKCRYLENSGCVGMCVNMCKIPTQDFFTNEFGLPLTMIPNFEDMSCEMVYGQVPPPFEEDQASKQPCYASICTIANPNSATCPKLQL